jgi:hypothetical protein
MRHHCINKKRSRMAVYNGNKQDSKIWVTFTNMWSTADSSRLPVGRITGIMVITVHNTKFTSSTENINIKFIHFPVQYECSMFKSTSRIELHRAESFFRTWQSSGLSRNSPLITQHDGQYRVYKSPPPLAVLSQIHFNIILPSMPSSSHWSLPIGLPKQNSVSIS